jgi:hypothetical protein
MSDEEMNIDEGTVSIDRFLFIGHLILPSGQWGRSRPEERPWVSEFCRFVSLASYDALCLDSDAILSPSAGNEGGVGSEQTYDRVESAPARDHDTRAARCERCRASFLISL